MYSKIPTYKYTGSYLQETEKLKRELETADAVLIGAGAGLSTSAGLTYSGERFQKYFSDFAEKYGIMDMYSGGFFPFKTKEEFWAWWSRHIWYNRYQPGCTEVYKKLYNIIKDKNYFVLTTNVDHQFQLAGFDRQRLFYTQGDYGLFQCTLPCHQKTYDNENKVKQMIEKQQDMKIPSELIPKCPVCGKPMTMNLRSDNTFVQDDGWYKAKDRYIDFIQKNEGSHILYLELGVGMNTPVIIKFLFWSAVTKNKNAVYACINYSDASCPQEISERAVCIQSDIAEVLQYLF